MVSTQDHAQGHVDDAPGHGHALAREAHVRRPFEDRDVARRGERPRADEAREACVDIKSSTILQCVRMRQFRRKLFGCASRTRREQLIRPKISRIDFDLIEIERFEVFAGQGVPPVDFHTGGRRRRRAATGA